MTDLPVDPPAIEVDRYTIWPGQALSYKLGQREIERATDEVAAAMGDRFDLRAFHDAVLGSSTISLPVLGAVVTRWVDDRRAA